METQRIIMTAVYLLMAGLCTKLPGTVETVVRCQQIEALSVQAPADTGLARAVTAGLKYEGGTKLVLQRRK